MKKQAAELVTIAKTLLAMPMTYDAPTTETTRWAKKTLMVTLGVDPSWREIYSVLLTMTEGTSNKFHYFGAYKNRATGECVGGNAYGRIGYNPKAIEVARGSESQVMSAVRQKLGMKQGKGYRTTEV